MPKSFIQVLRFFGWFKEIVTERREESWRIRKCVIYYYLEDDTIHISEPRIDNSGIPQGVFLKRMKAPKEDGSYVKFKDLNVGEKILLYTRTFHVVSCDDFTRKFLEESGMTVPEELTYPDDPYSIIRTKQKEAFAKQQRPMDQTAQTFFSRGAMSKKLLTMDRKVLRFYCVWEEDQIFTTERRHSVLHYYLADDTMEVLEVNDRNSGRDNFPLLLRRMKLTKGEAQTASDFWSDSGLREKYYLFTDLAIGKTVTVYGKELLLYDCDEFTREFYSQSLGRPHAELEPLDIFPKKEVKYTHKMDTPHAFTIGSDEDYIMSLQSLILKPPTRDMKKFVENDGVLLRFIAKIVDAEGFPLGSRYDQEREFVFTYFTVDDTILIFEPPQRNSGIVGGKFLERQKVKDPFGDFYTKLDMTLGNNIIIYSRAFKLESADEYTLSYMEKHVDLYPESNFALIAARLKSEFTGDKMDALKSALIDLDGAGTGMVGIADLMRIANQGGKLTLQEATTMCRTLSKSADTVEVASFLSAIS